MADNFRFPKGYEVRVLRKEDIINSIDKNIIDKEIAFEIIKRLEIDAARFLKEGKWAGIPHLGSIRMSKAERALQTTEVQELIKEAGRELDAKRYILFRKDLSAYYHKKEKAERYFNYVLSKMVNRNGGLYRRLAKEKGENYSRIYLVCVSEMKLVGGDFNYYG